jgi:hypothetical protein
MHVRVEFRPYTIPLTGSDYTRHCFTDHSIARLAMLSGSLLFENFAVLATLSQNVLFGASSDWLCLPEATTELRM